MNRRTHPFAVFAMALPLACISKDAVRIRVINAKEGEAIQDITVVSGPDKIGWSEMAPGDTESSLLYPNGVPPGIFMQYTRGDRTYHWSCSELQPGVGHRIVVRLGAGEHVDERHCTMPCDWPELPE